MQRKSGQAGRTRGLLDELSCGDTDAFHGRLETSAFHGISAAVSGTPPLSRRLLCRVVVIRLTLEPDWSRVVSFLLVASMRSALGSREHRDGVG